MKIVKKLVIPLLGLSVLAFLFRIDILLFAVGLKADSRWDIQPTQQIIWERPEAEVIPKTERPPNIVLIVADDLGWNDVSFYGGGLAGGTVPTPNIDAIAQQGVAFEQGYAANGTCAPSRAALMTGRYPTRFGFEFTPVLPAMMDMIGVIRNSFDRPLVPPSIFNESVVQLPYEEMTVPLSETLLPELLSSAGYRNLHIGKWHIGETEDTMPHARGFDQSLYMASGLYGKEDDPDIISSKQDFDAIDPFLWKSLRFASYFNTKGGSALNDVAFEPDRYLTDHYTHEAVKAIEANKDQPFFLYLAHWAPHTPLQASREDYEALSHIELHRERVHAAMIRSLDRGVGQVLQALKDNGIDDNTLVIFTSDNGAPGYIGLPNVNAPLRGWKVTHFDGGIRVPFFAKWPGNIDPGMRYQEPIHHTDIFSTIAAAAGVALPTDRIIDGVDILPFIKGNISGAPHQYLFWRSGAAQAVRSGAYKLNVSAPLGGARQEWLFDLQKDPGERNDLLTDKPKIADRLRAALAAHNASQAESLWDWHTTSSVNIDRDSGQPDQPGDTFINWTN